MRSNRLNLIDIYIKKNRPLVLDGAMGSLLQQSGISNDKFLWQSKVNIDDPKKVLAIHKDYITAGADIITTNTFRTNPIAVMNSNFDISCEEFVKKSVEIAIQASIDQEVIIAGSNAPAENCYQKERTISKYDLEYNHKKHIELLCESGIDIIWNETQSHWDEIEIIASFCSTNKLPFIISLFFENNLKLLSGEPIEEAINFLTDHSPEAIGFNCIKPETYINLFEQLDFTWKHGFYLNCGSGSITDEIITRGIDSNEYIETVKRVINSNTVFVGSCCGSTPAHTKKIQKYLNEQH